MSLAAPAAAAAAAAAASVPVAFAAAVAVPTARAAPRVDRCRRAARAPLPPAAPRAQRATLSMTGDGSERLERLERSEPLEQSERVEQSERMERSEPSHTYVSPLSTRYASAAMREIFSDATRFRLWRELWVALADAQRQLGLPISQQQLDALRAAPAVDAAAARRYEATLRHDVMAHVHALGDQAPAARAIIHLGATSCFVTDNADVVQMRAALDELIGGVWRCVRNLARFARAHAHTPTLAFTHLQAAQPTTVGKRAALWLQDFLWDAHNLEHVRGQLRLRGAKGTTGTQASFLALFDGDHDKVKRLDALVTRAMGFEQAWALTGQTYPRKQDFFVLSALAGVGQSAAKMGNDIRLLQHMKEVEEPFGEGQVGSSAMAYKRNPMRCERMNALSRFLQTLVLNPAETASTQWLERSLDDSANRRLATGGAFLSCDAIVQLALNVSHGLVVYPNMIERHLREELPFMATEAILMAAVRAGGDRQTLHEALRAHSMAAAQRVKRDALPNDLLQRVRGDERFAAVRERLPQLCDARAFVGRAPQQVEEFLREHVDGALAARAALLRGGARGGEVRV